jgi:hypothetical protein
MGELYLNSYITISVAAAVDSDHGCFPKRNEEHYVSLDSASLGFETQTAPHGPNSLSIRMRIGGNERCFT